MKIIQITSDGKNIYGLDGEGKLYRLVITIKETRWEVII